jgi:hypothetical protein
MMASLLALQVTRRGSTFVLSSAAEEKRSP